MDQTKYKSVALFEILQIRKLAMSQTQLNCFELFALETDTPDFKPEF
jgi:hypothetical protein